MEEQTTPHSTLGQFAVLLLRPPNRGQTLRANLQINPNFLHPELLKRRFKPGVSGNTKVISI